jgi:hypothetical protein
MVRGTAIVAAAAEETAVAVAVGVARAVAVTVAVPHALAAVVVWVAVVSHGTCLLLNTAKVKAAGRRGVPRCRHVTARAGAGKLRPGDSRRRT